MSIAEQIANTVADAVLSGEITEGATLNIAQLAKDLSVSRARIREAVIHLEHQGIVEHVQNRSPTVIVPSRDWLLVESARMRGLSVLAAEIAVPILAGDELRRVLRCTRTAIGAWEGPSEQLSPSIAVWDIFDELAQLSHNRHLAEAHGHYRLTLLHAVSQIGRPQDPRVVRRALVELESHVHERDGVGAAEVVGDMYQLLAAT